MKPKWSAFALASLFFTACTHMASGPMGDMEGGDDGAVGGISEVPNPTEAMAKAAGKDFAQIQRGHEVYMLKCGECHAYEIPEKVDIMDWEDAIPKMIGHAGLPASDEKAVLDYVKSVKVSKGQEF